jgi:hypothetical protein
MGATYYLIGIFMVIGGLIFIAIDNDSAVRENIQQDYGEARQLLATFGQESIAFDLEPQPPSTEFTYIQEIEEAEVIVVDEQGNETTEIQNVTTTKKVLTSEIYAELKDRQTGQIKIVKQGHQADITGTIILIDPVTTGTISPPYSLHFTLDCNFRNGCTTDPIGINTITDGEGKFKYTWSTSGRDTIGEYHAFVRVSSQTLDGHGNKQVLEHYLTLELIE